jgi:hypothetical protein
MFQTPGWSSDEEKDAEPPKSKVIINYRPLHQYVFCQPAQNVINKGKAAKLLAKAKAKPLRM